MINTQTYTVLDITLTSGFLFKRLAQVFAQGRTNTEDDRQTFTVDSGDLYVFLAKNLDEDLYAPITQHDILGVKKVRFIQGWPD